MNQSIHSTTTGASPALPASPIDLEQTIASDLPYTEDGVLDFGAMCSNANRFSKDWRINQMRQAIYGCSTIVRVLHVDDDSLCSMGAHVRGGLLSALTVMLGGLASDAEKIAKAIREQGKWGAA